MPNEFDPGAPKEEPQAPAESFPSVRYGPGGDARVFQSAEDVPAGWEDHPSKVKGPKAPAVDPKRLSRPELMQALRDRGVQFAPNAGGGELAALLAASNPQPVKVNSNGNAPDLRKAPSDALVDANAPEVIASIDGNTDLDALEAAEKARDRPRKSVLAAIKDERESRAK